MSLYPGGQRQESKTALWLQVGEGGAAGWSGKLGEADGLGLKKAGGSGGVKVRLRQVVMERRGCLTSILCCENPLPAPAPPPCHLACEPMSRSCPGVAPDGRDLRHTQEATVLRTLHSHLSVSGQEKGVWSFWGG